MLAKTSLLVLSTLFSSSKSLFSDGSISPRDSTITYSTSTYSNTLNFCTAFRNVCINFVGADNYHHQLDCVVDQAGNTIQAFCGGILKDGNGDTGNVDFTPDICTSSQLVGCSISSPPTQPTLQFDGQTSVATSTTSATSSSTTSTSSGTSSTSSSSTRGSASTLTSIVVVAASTSSSSTSSVGVVTSTAIIVVATQTASPTTSSTTSGMSLITLPLSTSIITSSTSTASRSGNANQTVGYLNPIGAAATSNSNSSTTTGSSTNAFSTGLKLNVPSVQIFMLLLVGIFQFGFLA